MVSGLVVLRLEKRVFKVTSSTPLGRGDLKCGIINGWPWTPKKLWIKDPEFIPKQKKN